MTNYQENRRLNSPDPERVMKIAWPNLAGNASSAVALIVSLSSSGCDSSSVDAAVASPTKLAASTAQVSDTRSVGRIVGVWQPPAGLEQLPIWPGRAPDTEGSELPPESVLVAETPQAIGGRYSEAVFDVSVPTMTIFPPQGTSTGAAIIVFPGGGFRAVVLTVGGTEVCAWLTSRGIAYLGRADIGHDADNKVVPFGTGSRWR